LGKK